MPITEGYSADFYCENSDKHIHPYNGYAQFSGQNRAECYKQARKNGWRLTVKQNAFFMECYCPDCKREF